MEMRGLESSQMRPRRKLATALLTVLVLGLMGCGNQQSWEEEERIRIAAARRPPPKPPNCPALPELKNITLKSGKIADVTIFRFRETVFYVPIEFQHAELPDETPPLAVGRYTPDFARVECPGVVHIVNPGYSDAGFGLGIQDADGKFYPGNIARDSEVTGLTFRLTALDAVMSQNSAKGRVAHFDSVGGISFYIRVADDTGISLIWRANEIKIPGVNILSPYVDQQREDIRAEALLATSDWSKTRASIVDYFRWVTTPPRMRDNGRVFYLGSKR